MRQQTPSHLLPASRCRHRRRRDRGFTLIESLVSLMVLGLGFTLTVPAFINFIQRGRIEGTTREAAQLLRRARAQAIRFRSPTVVAIDTATREFYAFVDVHGMGADDPPDGLFGPLGGLPRGATDFEIGRVPLASGIDFRFLDTVDEDSVDGFNNSGNPDPPDAQVIFQPLGSVLSAGAFRFADPRGNYFEARVSPAGTARVALRKWDGEAWREFGEGGQPWQWN